MRKLALLGMVLAGVAVAAERPDLNGTWQLDPSRSQGSEAKVKAYTLTLRQTEDDVALSESITDNAGKERKADIQCKTDGGECKVKQGTVSLWYDGASLVLMEVRRNNTNVVKRRFQTSEDGKTLTMEIAPIAPPGQKVETLTFTKQAAAANQ
jgi:hypothetical protein